MKEKNYKDYAIPAIATNFVARMLTRDLFAVAHLVMIVYLHQ